MKRLLVAGIALLLSVSTGSSFAFAGYINFTGLVRSQVISIDGQTFSWSSGGLNGTVTVRPSGTVANLTTTTPSTSNGRGTRSNFYTGVRSAGGTVGAYFEFLFNFPIDITVFNGETLASKERITLQTDGTPWTGGWYESTGNLFGIGTRTVQMSTSGPAPPYPYASLSSKGVRRLEFSNELILAATEPGAIGNQIEIQIDSVAVPEPVSIHFVATLAAFLTCGVTRRRRSALRIKS